MIGEIRADYDQLDQVANRFLNQAQTIQQMLQTVQNSMGNLEGEWIGQGAEAFFSEMQGEVMPASQRLQQALDEAGRITKFIAQTLQQADEDAASPFRIN